ncbi:ubiquitin-protein ligase PSH1 LALA0_S06e05006g [Lachancea lanzarotensis]|uniref:LALA0S06e05006g1_1 n=1 Tax=Lachancea lanzarotensis TaxID=1245769 RepID=A0A0C7N8F5_9SACH|nr:uncharacterized protein LALA0_S06e05006g [Lachancea lanzarotensis]CEP62839.1 LALA0S06e05006g1_1 [Lachancea lanzarotensis]
MYVPVMTLCGHNYCYECISNWLVSNNANELTCPQCRSPLEQAPAVNSALQDLLSAVIDRDKEAYFTVDAERTESLRRYKDDLETGTLYKNAFKNTAWAVVDDDDGVARCSSCHWEVEGGTCPHCGARLRNRRRDYEESDGESILTDGSGTPLPRVAFDRQAAMGIRGTSYSESYSGESVGNDMDSIDSNDSRLPSRDSRIILNYLNANGLGRIPNSDSERDSDLDSFIVDEADEADEDEVSRDGSGSSTSLRDVDGTATRPVKLDDIDHDSERDSERDSDFWEHNEENGHVSGDSLESLNDNRNSNRKVKKRRFQVIEDSDED